MLGVGITHLKGSTPRPSGSRQRKEMKLPPSLGLRTIYMVPLHGRTNLTTRVWVRSLGIRMGMC